MRFPDLRQFVDHVVRVPWIHLALPLTMRFVVRLEMSLAITRKPIVDGGSARTLFYPD